MKELPILYNTDMVLAKLDGRKTLTRRPMKPQPTKKPENVLTPGLHARNRDGIEIPKYYDYWWPSKEAMWMVDLHEISAFAPYKPGDILYVRETWAKKYISQTDYTIHYAAGGSDYKGTWRPSIHMPKEVARIWERVVSVRPERLQDITEEDAIKEGVLKFPEGYIFNNYLEDATCKSAIDSFISLWISVYGDWVPETWVWRIETEILSTTGRPKDI